MSKPKPKTITIGPPTSAGFEGAARTTPMGIELEYDFASPAAEELWRTEGRPMLRDAPSGETGYTVADVRAALAPKGA